METEALNRLLEKSAELAKGYYTDPEMDGHMTVFIECEDQKFNAMWSLPNMSNEFKQQMMFNIAASMKLRKAKAYSFMAMAWASNWTEGDMAKGHFVPPSESKDRREILLVNAVGRNGAFKTAIFDVKRDENSKLVGFVNDENSQEVSKQEGLINEFFEVGDELEKLPDFEWRTLENDHQMAEHDLMVSGHSIKDLKVSPNLRPM